MSTVCIPPLAFDTDLTKLSINDIKVWIDDLYDEYVQAARDIGMYPQWDFAYNRDFLALEKEWTRRECPNWFQTIDIPPMVNGYSTNYRIPIPPVRYWTYLRYVPFLESNVERIPYEQFDVDLCAEWYKNDFQNDSDDSDESGTPNRSPDIKNYYESNKRALYNLPYPIELIKDVQEIACSMDMDSVTTINYMCEWITQKHKALTNNITV